MYNFTSGLSSIQEVWWWSLMIPINFHIFGGVSQPLDNFLVPWWYVFWYVFTKHCKICAVFSCFQITHLHTYTYAHINPHPYIIYIYIFTYVCLFRCFRIIYMYKITSSNIEAVFQCPKTNNSCAKGGPQVAWWWWKPSPRRWWNQKSDLQIHQDIHVASRRQPPAPHRWAAARNCQWCRPLRPKTSESTDCRKKKREEFDSHV